MPIDLLYLIVYQILEPILKNALLIHQIYFIAENEMSSIVFDFTGNNIEMHVNHTKYFVDMSTTRQVNFEKTDGDIMSSNSKNMLQGNWKLITILYVP